MWGMSFVFDVASLRLGPAMVEAARFNLAAGLVMAVVAAAAGVRDFLRLPLGATVRRIGRWHAALNILAAALFSVSLGLRFHFRGAPTPPWPFFLSALGVVVIGFSGYLGGVMVYNHGAGVNLTRSRRSPPALR